MRLSPKQHQEINQLLPDHSLVFELEGDSFIAIKLRHRVCIYHNVCPHQHKRLAQGCVWDDSHTLLECQHHGAQFLPATGQCVSGPCLGAILTPYTIKDTPDGASLEAI